MLIRELMTNNPLRRRGHDVGNMEDGRFFVVIINISTICV